MSKPSSSTAKVHATLDLSRPEMKRALGEACDLVETYFESVNDWPIFPKVNGRKLRRLLRETISKRSTPADQVVREIRERIMPQGRHNLHPRFFGYVSSSGNPVGAIADLLTSTLNQNVTSWRSAPGPTELEMQTIDWIKEIIGYPKDAMGMFMSGGSLATLQAMAIARQVQCGRDIMNEGVQSLGEKRLVLYMSKEGHMSIPKAAGILGLGKSAVHMVATDKSFQMDLSDLRARIAADRKNGRLPFCAVGTAGTVNTGAIDDLEGIARICRNEGLWFHVDGAYGGFASLAPSVKKRFRGMGKADSVSLDPHKWLYQPLDAGCVLVRNRAHALRTFSGSGDYARVITGMPGEEFAFFEQGMELSRRFRALKIWMALKCYGTDRLRDCVETNLEMAQHLKSLVEQQAELELMAPVELSIVCFRYRPDWSARGASPAKPWSAKQLDAFNHALMAKLQRDGVAYVSNAVLDGRFALRPCILSYRTEARDLEILVNEIVRWGRRLEKDFL